MLAISRSNSNAVQPHVVAQRRGPQRAAVRRRRLEPGDPRALRRAARLLDCAESRMRFLEMEAIDALVDEAEALSHDDARCRARALTLRMRIHRMHDRVDAAMQAAGRAVEAWQALGDAGGESAVRTQIAHILLAVGDSDEALVEGMAAMTLAETASDDAARAEALRVVASVYLAVSQFDRCAALCERGIAVARASGNAIAEGALLDTLGCAYGSMAYVTADAGDTEHARALNRRSIDASREAMAIARACGHHANEATAVANVAEGLVQDGRPDEGLSLMETYGRDHADPSLAASHHLDTWGSICLALGRIDEAIDLFRRAHATSMRSVNAMLALEHAAEAYERKGDLAEALAHHKRYHAMFRQVTSEKAQRSASIAAVRLETQQARASANASRSLAEDLQRSNDQLSRRAEDLMHQSLHDALTGLGNRRLMERLLAADASRYAIALVDVDHFKAINDGWSHLIGDRVLQELALLIRGGCRPTDTPIRYGGEEFAILLCDVDEAPGGASTERIRHAIETFDWGRIAAGLSVTVSIGLAFGFEADDSMTVLGLADGRLYGAKSAGRNRVVGRLRDA